jgi:glutamate--cysteine ligase
MPAWFWGGGRQPPAGPVRHGTGADAPAPVTADPAAAWARSALRAPVICVHRPGGCWDAPPRMTFADWIDGALPEPPTTADLDYHLSTLFPPVRPRGYLEVRYLDAQPRAGLDHPRRAAGRADVGGADCGRGTGGMPSRCRAVAACRAPGARRPAPGPCRPVITQLGTSALSRTAGLPVGLAERVADDLDHRLGRPAA